MQNQTEALVTLPAHTIQTKERQTIGVFQDIDAFKHAQRVALMFCSSPLVPKHFQGTENVGSACIALDMAFRLCMNPLMVMQQLYVVSGKPGWSAQFIIAVINASGRFTPLRYKYTGEGETRQCVAHAKDIKSGEVLESTPVSIKLAKAEGWFSKPGSKWQTMPEQMLAYRSASFWGRMYAPEMFMGLPTTDEIKDMRPGDIELNPEEEITFSTPTPKTRPAAITREASTAAPELEPTPSEPAQTETPPAPVSNEATPAGEFGQFMIDAGVSFDDFKDWIRNRNLVPDPDALGGYSDLPAQAIEKLKADTKAITNCVRLYGKRP